MRLIAVEIPIPTADLHLTQHTRTYVVLYIPTTIDSVTSLIEDGQHQDVDRTLSVRVNQNDRGQG